LDDLMTSYTNARSGAGLLVVDLHLGSVSGLLASRCRAVLKRCNALHLEALLVRKFCDPLERLLAVDGELP
jgi:hypothetical protein